ncbi:hypothetical protein D3C77_502140 [compost metagenome]
MRLCEIDGDFVESFLEVKNFSELVRRAKEHLAHDVVSPMRFRLFQSALDIQVVPNLIGKEQRSQQHTYQYAVG